jgi:release factor glutamine methyltransferase
MLISNCYLVRKRSFGNIACLIAYHVSDAFVYASDLSPEAVGLAKRNAEFLNIDSRMEFRCGDLLKPFEEEQFYSKLDLITCNPPYISSTQVDAMNTQIKNHEPRLAFDGGPFGINILQKLISDIHRFLTPGGYFAFEVGLGQGEFFMKRLQKSPHYFDIDTLADNAGNIRVLRGRRNE